MWQAPYFSSDMLLVADFWAAWSGKGQGMQCKVIAMPWSTGGISPSHVTVGSNVSVGCEWCQQTPVSRIISDINNFTMVLRGWRSSFFHLCALVVNSSHFWINVSSFHPGFHLGGTDGTLIWKNLKMSFVVVSPLPCLQDFQLTHSLLYPSLPPTMTTPTCVFCSLFLCKCVLHTSLSLTYFATIWFKVHPHYN